MDYTVMKEREEEIKEEIEQRQQEVIDYLVRHSPTPDRVRKWTVGVFHFYPLRIRKHGKVWEYMSIKFNDLSGRTDSKGISTRTVGPLSHFPDYHAQVLVPMAEIAQLRADLAHIQVCIDERRVEAE